MRIKNSLKKVIGVWLLLSVTMVLSLSAAPLKIMPLGDSITEGDSQVPVNMDQNISDYTPYSGDNPPNADRISYRGKLWDLLKADGYTFDETSGDLDFVGTRNTGSNYNTELDTDHEGFGGKTSKEIRDGIAGWLDSKPADIVLLHIGTNDPGKGIEIGSYDDADQDANTSVNNVRKILNTIFTKNPDAKVMVARIIKAKLAESWGSWNTSNFNNKIEEMVNHHSKSAQIKMVNMENGAGLEYDHCGLPHDMQPYHGDADNTYDFHPTVNGYTKMAQKWHDDLMASGWLPMANDKAHLWTLNESGSPFADTGAGSDAATCSGDACPTQIAGKVGNARGFNGTQRLSAIASGYAADESYSIELWMKPDTTTGLEVVFREGNESSNAIWVGREGTTLKYELPGGPGNHPAGTLNSGWNHVVIVKDAGVGKAKAYINGVETDDSASTATAMTATDLFIGAYDSGQGYPYHGDLDEVALYGKALSVSEVEGHYNAQAGEDETAPVLSVVTPVTTPTNDTTPSYTFHSTEGGTIAVAGSCGTATPTSAVAGNNIITFATLPQGDYSGCTVTVTDAAGNASTPLTIADFTIDTSLATPKSHLWTLNDAAAPFADTAGANNATCSGDACPTQTAGKVDNARDFNGTQMITATVGDYAADKSFSVEFWVNPKSGTTGREVMVHKGEMWIARTDDNLEIEYKAGEIRTLVGDLTEDAWNHVVVVRDASGSKAIVYINGVQTKEENITSVAINGALNIGSHTATGYNFNGALDEVALYDGALNASEITDHYTAQNGGDDTEKPVITLLGEATVTLTVGDAYTDAGATANDNKDGNITANIVTVNPVDTATAGNYTVTYDVNDTAGNQATQVTRTVTVNPDTTAPVITLLGSNPMTITVGGTFTDPGATATDNVDSNVTVTASGTVDTSAEGNYTVTYSASDDANNTATITRTVEVVAAGTADTTKPMITLIGDAAVTLTVGDAYIDAGATATDNVDTNVTVTTSGTVDTTTAGTYTITYSASDAAGNAADAVTRTVTVNAADNGGDDPIAYDPATQKATANGSEVSSDINGVDVQGQGTDMMTFKYGTQNAGDAYITINHEGLVHSGFDTLGDIINGGHTKVKAHMKEEAGKTVIESEVTLQANETIVIGGK
jgi:hypothetical protein